MQNTRDDQDWLVQLIHTPIGSVVTSGATAPPEAGPADPQPAAEPVDERISTVVPAKHDGTVAEAAPAASETIQEVPLDAIRPNPNQPRRSFDAEELQALADSIAAQGVIQPIVLRTLEGEYGAFQIVAGERRWRAARMAGLASIPALIRRLTDSHMSEVALVENIQRADLSPLDEAHAYQQLIETHGLTQDEIARHVGKNRSHIAHMLRLQRLPAAVQQMIRDGALSVGHARVLVNAADPEGLARRVVAQGLTVRQTEEAAKAARDGDMASPSKTGAKPAASPESEAWATRFKAVLQRPVTVKAGRKGGSLVIRYDSDEDLASILSKIGG